MNQTTVSQKLAVAFKEIGARQSFRRFLHLRIGEGQPNLAHLTGREEAVDKLDACAQKAHVWKAFAKRCLSTVPHARSFDVNADEVLVGITAGKTHRVFTAATAKLQDNWVWIFEEILVPMALKGKTITLQLPVRALHHQWILLHILKFRKFAFSHKSYCVRLMKYLGCTNILSFLIPHIPLKCCSTLSGDDASCVVLRDLPRRALSAIVGTYYMYVRHSGTCPSYPDAPL